jgi:hypothetical protein
VVGERYHAFWFQATLPMDWLPCAVILVFMKIVISISRKNKHKVDVSYRIEGFIVTGVKLTRFTSN